MTRVVVVTGATRGIGRGIADAFARRGDTLVIAGRSTDANPNRVGLPGTLEGAARELRAAGSEVLTVNADLTKTDDAQRVVDVTLDAFGVPDVLVNNAAATFIGPFLDVPASRWRVALDLNLLAPVTLIQGFLPGMLERGHGRIINVTSAAARTHELPAGGVPQLCYGASKAALDSLTYGLARDFAGMGVSFNLLAPVVLTESVEYHLTGDRFDSLKQRMAGMAPYGEAVASVADQPVEFTAQYLENEDLARLGFLVESS
jgi:NAD(P)-dependent dehydrogenase (short-subunit alcohol dehydrogenase family)